MNKKISVIIPVWNGEKYLAEAIESVLMQDYLDKEIIVVNDGSTDKTADVIRQFDKEVISIYQENRGLGAARNAGIKIAQGDYFAFLDHDDIWIGNKLSEQMHLLSTQENDPLIFTQLKQFICASLTGEEKQKISVNEAVLPGYLAGTLLLSRKRFYQVGYFIEQKQLGEFIEWYLRVMSLNIPIMMLEKLGLYRRVHHYNMGRQHDIYTRTDYLKILKTNLDRRRAK